MATHFNKYQGVEVNRSPEKLPTKLEGRYETTIPEKSNDYRHVQTYHTVTNNDYGFCGAGKAVSMPSAQQYQYNGVSYTPGPPGEITTNYAERAMNKDIYVHDREKPERGPHRYNPAPPTPLQFGYPVSNYQDPGVCAVSNALFSGSSSFKPINLYGNSIFRKRRKGDCSSEWSTAFVSHHDPLECGNPEYIYTPYEINDAKHPQDRYYM